MKNLKVLMLNGSPHANGNTAVALREMEEIFKASGVEVETVLGMAPKTLFQYVEATTGIWLMVKYLLSTSKVVDVPPRQPRALRL